MTQSKTSLILNNLVELNIPTCTDSKYLTFSESTEMGQLTLRLCFPFAFLLQKVQLEESHQESAKQFNIEMITKHAVTHGQMRTIVHETEIIDFKKEKIDWRFKTRMRSNSNEFLESPMALMQKKNESAATPYFRNFQNQNQEQEPADSEDLSILSSDEEFELKQDGKITILGNGISNQFTLFVSSVRQEEEKAGALPNSPSSLKQTIENFRLGFPSIRLFVWPNFRLPTGSSVIALINTSFLFAQKRLDQERIEADFLVALSLISGRKFIQASEKLRKIQSGLLNQTISVRSLLQAMNIEMIIGESMNQHSQISEKMYAFQRAVLFFKLARRIEKHKAAISIGELDQVMNTCTKTRLKQEEAYKYLLRLQPHLVDVLLLNIDSHMQAVRMASLKTLEFIFDTLGCNLDESLLQILVAIIKTYPSMSKRGTLPKNSKVISFFEDQWQIGTADSTVREDQPAGQTVSLSQKLERFRPETLGDQSQYSTFFSLNDLHSLKDCQVKDASLFHQSFIQTSKNFYNHILESLVFLISSTSTPLLVRIFYEVIQRVLFQESVEADLQVYLLRLADKILQLCQGNLTVDRVFLNTLFDLVLGKTNGGDNALSPNGKAAPSHQDSIGKAANDLWQTLKTSYLLQQSYEGVASFIQWVVLQMNALTEKVTSVSTSGSSNRDSDFTHDFTSYEQPRNQAQLRDASLSVGDQHKLLQLLELSNLLIYGQLRQKKSLSQAGNCAQFLKDNVCKSDKRNLQKITARELEHGMSFNEDTVYSHTEACRGDNFGHSRLGRRQRSGTPLKLTALEMCKLIEPVVFWLNFSIERPERINYFKVIWGTLTKLVQVMPKRKDIGAEFNCIKIILPTLQRVEGFCRTSSPSQEMLQFLIVVFSDIKHFLLSHSHKRVKKELFTFLDSFITTFARIIPHNLHDEVFEVCTLLIDLAGTSDRNQSSHLTQQHVMEILQAMVHKYTMRSKAHKRLSDQFLQKWILNQSLVQMQEIKNLEHQLAEQRQQQQLQQVHHAVNYRVRTASQNFQDNELHIHAEEAMIPQPMSQQVAYDEQSHSEEEQRYVAPAQPYAGQQQLAAPQQPPHNIITNSTSLDSLHASLQQPAPTQYQSQQPRMEQRNRSSSMPGNLYVGQIPSMNAQLSGLQENESTQANENGSNPNIATAFHDHQFASAPANSPSRDLYFDTLCEFSLFQNFLPLNDQFVSEQDHEQLCFEKLQVLQELIEALREEHNYLFKRLLQHPDFNHKVSFIFMNERARVKIIKLLKSMSSYFLKYNSPKTFYEHPIVHNSNAVPMPNAVMPQQRAAPQQQQTSARQFQGNPAAEGMATGGHSMLHFGQQLHSEPSLDLLNFINSHEEENGNTQNVTTNAFNTATAVNATGNVNTAENLHSSTHEQVRGRTTHHYSQHVERQQHELFNFNQNEVEDGESPRLVPSNVNLFLYDEVNLINTERLILIQIYSILIRTQMEQFQTGSQAEKNAQAGFDSQSQLQALNMIDMLLFSLCPTPSFQNMVIRYLLNPEANPVPAGGAIQANKSNVDFPYQIFQPHRLSFQFTGLNSMLGSQMGISNQEAQNDTIPDFETMQIRDGRIIRDRFQGQIDPNSFQKEFECWDIRYQHSRLALAFKFWPFVENAVLTSSWNNVRAACYSVLSKAVLIPDVSQMSTNYQKRLKELLFPLLNKLIKSKECEGRAAGLNILGSFCGLSSFQTPSYRQSFEFSQNNDSSADVSHSQHGSGNVVFDCDQDQDYRYDRYEQRQRESLGRSQIKIREHLHIFRRNSAFVSLAIWQEVFDMQEDWNEDIAQAAEVLTQLCAPKDSVKHFKKMSREKYQLRVCEVQNQLKQLYSKNKGNGMQHMGFVGNNHAQSLQSTGRSHINSQSVVNGIQTHDMLAVKQGSQQQLMSAHAGLFNQDFNMSQANMTGKGTEVGVGPTCTNHQQQQVINESDVESFSEEDSSSESEGDHAGDDYDPKAFYMENYSERQLQHAVSLFSTEFKPMSGLQAEQHANQIQRKDTKRLTIGQNGTGLSSLSAANGLGLPHDDDYGDHGNPNSNFLIDLFEDNMLEEVASTDSKDDDDDSKKPNMSQNDAQGVSGSLERQQTTSQSDGEDLGIIDLDKQEGSEYDDFDQLDDEKLPVLKNTYSKKNRPNNSKSVAIGSRSQGDVLRIRSQALKVLKAADEEIKVQINQHPEMRSSLQRGLQQSHPEKRTSLEVLAEERWRCLDDLNLHYQALADDVLSCKSESANHLQNKRRIQSGKWPPGDCLSEDRHGISERDRHSSRYSKTDSSNASQSTPMEIGDIQIAMRYEALQCQPKRISAKKSRQHDFAVDAENPSSDDQREIRSQDNRNKRKASKFDYYGGHYATSQKVLVGNLSEFDNSEKVSADDVREDEYEVISAPVRQTKGMRTQNLSSANKLGHQTDKMSIDSMTDLSPFADEAGSGSVKTFNTAINKEQEDEAAAAIVTKKKGGLSQRGSGKAQASQKTDQVMPQKSLQTISKKQQHQQPTTSTSSSYLQGLGKSSLGPATTVSRLSQQAQKLTMKGQTKNSQPAAISQQQLKIVPQQRPEASEHQESIGQPVPTVSHKLVSLQKPILNSVHSQQVMMQPGGGPSLPTGRPVAGVKSSKISHAQQISLGEQMKSSVPTSSGTAQSKGIAPNQSQRVSKEKRPSSLGMGHLPSEKASQLPATKTGVKRNNFVMQASPKAATVTGISYRSKTARAKVPAGQQPIQEVTTAKRASRGRNQRTSKQADIKYQATTEDNEVEQCAAKEGYFIDDSDTVEDL